MNDVLSPEKLATLDEQQLRELAQSLISELSVHRLQIEKLKFELATLRRLRFGRLSEQLDATQLRLFEEDALGDIAEVEAEIARIVVPRKATGQKPRRLPLPEGLPHIDIHHEPEAQDCACGCRLVRIGEDVSRKLDYRPGSFSVERHIRGRWACRQCERITQAPMPAHIIDKGIATPGLLAQVLVSKYADHTPLHRQQAIYAREGVTLPLSTLCDWVGECGAQLQPLVDALKAALLKSSILHADETGVQMLTHRKDGTGDKAGNGKGRNYRDRAGAHRAYLWVYASTRHDTLKAVVYDFTDSRAGEHCRRFLGDWQGKLICDDYAGYKACFSDTVIELGCMAHARRKFFEVFSSNQSPVAGHVLQVMKALYRIERKARRLNADDRKRLRHKRAGPLLTALHTWLEARKDEVLPGSAIANAIDYSLRRWTALTRYVDDGMAAMDNNHIENLIRPVALGRKNWLFAGSLRAGQRAAAIMSLIQSAVLNGHDPHAWLKDVLTRLPLTRAADIETLLPHNWKPAQPQG